jgi:hypothetical protein
VNGVELNQHELREYIQKTQEELKVDPWKMIKFSAYHMLIFMTPPPIGHLIVYLHQGCKTHLLRNI